MTSYRTIGLSHGAGSLARSYPSVVLLPAGAPVEPPRLPERKIGRPVASRATELLPLRTQAKTRRASQAWRDIRPRAAKAGSSPGLALETLSGLARNPPMCARWIPGIVKPHAAYGDQVGGSPR